jgi:hypothetical protein
MAAFMDESGIDARNGHPHRRESLPSHFKITTLRKGLFPYHLFQARQICNSLTGQCWLASHCNVYLAGTATEHVIKRGGEAAMR